MGYQKWLRLYAPIFLNYFWRPRWCDEQARLCPKDAESCRSRINFWPIWALFEWFGLLSLGQPLQIFLFNFIFFLPLGHVHLWSDEQARLCPKDAESCRSRIDFRHFLPGCSALFVQDFPRYLDAYQPVYGYCCTAFNQGHTDIFVIRRLFLRDTWRKKNRQNKTNKKDNLPKQYITTYSSFPHHTHS